MYRYVRTCMNSICIHVVQFACVCTYEVLHVLMNICTYKCAYLGDSPLVVGGRGGPVPGGTALASRTSGTPSREGAGRSCRRPTPDQSEVQ